MFLLHWKDIRIGNAFVHIMFVAYLLAPGWEEPPFSRSRSPWTLFVLSPGAEPTCDRRDFRGLTAKAVNLLRQGSGYDMQPSGRLATEAGKTREW